MLPALRGCPEVRLGAVMVRDQARAAAIAAVFGAQRAYSRVEDLLADPEIEAVYIATPPNVHRAHVEAAAAAGKHILLEKPLAIEERDGEAMIAAAARAGVQFAVCFPLRHTATVRTLAQWMRDGTLGEMVYLRAQMAKRYALEAGDWRADRVQAGGGVIMDLGSHLLDLAVALGGPLRRVQATMSTRLWPIDVEDTALLLLDFESGAAGSVELSFAVGGEASALEVYGTEACAEQVPGGLRRMDKQGGTQSVPVAEEDVYLVEALDFSRALRAGRAPLTSADDGLVNIHWLQAAYAAARGLA
jgi:1,5-anhydro-D-fructose reductase (1,5-anhydro-D-mannitol-forming)